MRGNSHALVVFCPLTLHAHCKTKKQMGQCENECAVTKKGLDGYAKVQAKVLVALANF